MRAIVLREGRLKVREIADPVPGPGQLLLRVVSRPRVRGRGDRPRTRLQRPTADRHAGDEHADPVRGWRNPRDRPVASIYPTRVPHEHVGYVLADLAIDRRHRHRVTSASGRRSIVYLNAGSTSCSKRRRLDHASSMGIPPHSGWRSANGNGAAFTSSTNCCGVSTRYWLRARSSSTSRTVWNVGATAARACHAPYALVSWRKNGAISFQPCSGSVASAVTRFSPNGNAPGSGRPSFRSSSR